MRLSLIASLALALALTPAAGDAQRGQPPDTARAGTVREAAAGDVALAPINRGLTQNQVRELQQTLRAIGCDPGEIDGMIGPQTRQALACARRQRNVASMNLNDLLRSLGLGFTAGDSLAVGAATQVGAGAMRAAGTYDYGDPTFVRDTGVITVNLDTLPADALGPGGVFVSGGAYARVGGNVWLRETSQRMRRDTTAGAAPDTAIYRPVTPPARAEPAPAARRDTVRTPVRVDTVVVPLRVRTDTVITPTRDDTAARPVQRADTTRTPARVDTTRRVLPDSVRGPLPDSTLRRMRDELLLMPPPPGGARPDSVQRADTTRRTPPDTSRTPPDTTRRRPPPIDRR